MRRLTAVRSDSSVASVQSSNDHAGVGLVALVGRGPVAGVGGGAVALVHAHRGRGQLADPAQDGQRRRDDRVPGEVVVQRDRVDARVDPAAREQGRHRRGEPDVLRAGAAAGGGRHVQRLDAEPVAGHDGAAGVPLADDAGEHAEQPLDPPRAPLRVAAHDDLGVAGGEEPVAEALELGAELAVVVDHAVEDDGEAELVVDHGLGAALGQVDDLEPAVAERDVALRPDAGAVGPPGRHDVRHPVDRRDVRARAVEGHLSAYAAHGAHPSR